VYTFFTFALVVVVLAVVVEVVLRRKIFIAGLAHTV
jgi:hypothetical protein